MNRLRLTLPRAAFLTGLYLLAWGGLAVFRAAALAGSLGDPANFTLFGHDVLPALGWAVDPGGWIGLYLIGCVGVVYLLEWAARRIEVRWQPTDPDARPLISVCGETPGGRRGKWNPLDPAARFYTFTPAFLATLLFVPLAVAAWLPVVIEKVMLVPSATPLLGAKAMDFYKSLHGTWAPVPSVVAVLAVVALATAVAQARRVRQSLSVLTAYSLVFLLAYFIAHQSAAAGDEIESDIPAGGGNDSIKATAVKVQKVVRKKYVINPYSSIVFAAPPPIDKIEMKFNEETANQYKAGSGPGGLGQGSGKGGGFGSGTGAGKYELVRLRHSDGSWNKNFGIGGDRNLLAELKAREPLVKIAEEDKSVDFQTLSRAAAKKPFPLVYIGGAHTFAPTEAERKILREYLIDKHGMVLGDNLGGHGFHHNFVAEMNRITGVTAVVVPRDDRIHQRPYDLPQLPFVVNHAPGKAEPLGWKIDGRWAVYYHPGALSDAWRDDHAGIKKAVWENCYQLGINILFYAYAEQDKWRSAQQQ